MGLVSIATMGAWKFVALLGYAALYAYVAPWHLPSTQWYTWVIAIVGVDVLFYAYHRIAHRVRLIWATHQAHHSSQYFNFATALRQKWNNSGEIVMWIPLPLLGVPPWMVFASFSVNLDLPVLDSHRADRKALAARRIRLQHAVAPPGAPRHGPAVPGQELRRHLHPVGPAVRQLSGRGLPAALWADQAGRHLQHLETADPRVRGDRRDVRPATRWRDKLGYVFGPPGWEPAGRRLIDDNESAGVRV